jgi:HEAT repeat protein
MRFDYEQSRELEKAIDETAYLAASRYVCPEQLEGVRTLGTFGQDAVIAVPDLILCLKHSHQEVRRAAVLALGRIGPKAEEAIPCLLRLKNDRSRVVRAAAEKALTSIAA